MNPETELERTLRHVKTILSIFLAIALLYLMRELSNLLIPLFFALFFAILFQPLVNLFSRLLPVSVSIALTTLTFVIIFSSIGFGLYNVVQTLLRNSDAILNSISTEIRPLINSYTGYFGIEFQEGEIRGRVAQLLQSASFWAASGSFLNAISGISASLLMTILYFAGMLGAITRYDKTIAYIVTGTAEDQEEALRTFNRVKDSVSKYIKVKTFVSLITGFAVGWICWFFGIGYALLWGSLAFALNYIPYVGSLIAVIPPLVLGIIAFDNLGQVFLLFACLEGIQLLMGNVVEPKWMGDSFSINTVSVLFGFVFWAFMWGPAGMLLAVPLTFLFKVIIEHVSDAKVLVRLMEKKPLTKSLRKAS